MYCNFIGSSTVEVSTANHEVVPNTPESWTYDKYFFKSFSFINKDECTVKINGSEPILLEAEQGFDSNGIEIRSFIIVESDIRFTFIGAF